MSEYLSRILRISVFSVTAVILFPLGVAQAEALPDFVSLVKEQGPAVVNISVEISDHSKNTEAPALPMPDFDEDDPTGELFRKFFEQMPRQNLPETGSLGSGFVISRDGFILTNAHVISKADRVLVTFTDRREFEATIVGSDNRSDVALLKIEANDLPVVRLGDSESVQVGEWILAIGSPFGFENSAASGIVSGLGRSLPNETYVPFIQTDAPINPGNSGGPLFNMNGEVIGVNSQIYTRTGGSMGLSFAIPINVAMRVVDQLKSKGRVSRGWLGVGIQDVTQDLAESFGMKRPRGALVTEVLEGSPASHGGIAPGDVITLFDSIEIDRMSDLPPVVGSTPVGSEVDIEVIRKGHSLTLKITIGELDDGVVMAPSEDASSPEDGLILGMNLTPLTNELKDESNLNNGLLVGEVGEGAGLRAGIKQGDILIQAGGVVLRDLHSLSEIIDQTPEGKSLAVLIRRGGSSLFIAIKP
ncbi:MAG: serine peptidase [Acidiferrobacteraceae bacterium]|jgi:serine protease Do|nr:serine peptidase [Acidiferrobacteraceae bacterium]MDP6123133.1 DegQ family serine endoprotease [Arenicellales bacterium]MDP6435546.1 DegQ family serine endoprotease [Arenicellales bacterium]MDP6672245.1 DegQ family serine endoprotease [Arenicellales bacterium]MDP6723791.1 DegQ family serine endoprotease [Arenicellales bacterium]|tara:strand:+ start:45751 stop:47169 length:1419 start_codon:yes stop_codon:yes gene_type:complete